jgi:uncharacterized damage-inducible protein DinB
MTHHVLHTQHITPVGTIMPRVAALVAELEQEAATTRRLLERLPDEKLDWKPHAKSRSLGALAMHIATTPGDVLTMAMQNPAMPPNAPDVSPATAAEVLTAFDASIAHAVSLLRSLSDAQLDESWSMVVNGKVVMHMPRGALVRTVALSHWYHHRGQLSVYVRLLDVPLPSIYGPSADENPFA